MDINVKAQNKEHVFFSCPDESFPGRFVLSELRAASLKNNVTWCFRFFFFVFFLLTTSVFILHFQAALTFLCVCKGFQCFTLKM